MSMAYERYGGAGSTGASGRSRGRGLEAGLPSGITSDEAVLVLELFARLKRHRFGRLELVVSDGRLVDAEVRERIDRNLLNSLSGLP